jgi:hypothetical protein
MKTPRTYHKRIFNDFSINFRDCFGNERAPSSDKHEQSGPNCPNIDWFCCEPSSIYQTSENRSRELYEFVCGGGGVVVWWCGGCGVVAVRWW